MLNARQKRMLDDLARQNGGRITPDAVIALAKPVRSPLHRQFTWDNDIAAVQWRRQEARKLIVSYEYIVTEGAKFIVSAPMFVRDPSVGSEQGYISTIKLRSDEDLARDVCVHEFTMALGCLRRAKAVSAACNMEAMVDELHAQVQQATWRAQGAAGTAD